MNNKKIRLTRWAILPILCCSAAVLAGDGGIDAPYGQLPPTEPQAAMTVEAEPPAPAVVHSCDSGNPARGECPTLAAADTVAAVPDTMQQARQLGAESDGFVDDSTPTSGVSTGYVGGQTRLGIGIDSELKGKADVSHIFSENENSTLIGQGYMGVNPKADGDKGQETITGAGAKLNYHWTSNGENGQVSHVNKVFGAYDQNEQKDKKITAGYGQENENLFWSGHLSKGISDKRDTGAKDANGNTIYEKAYDWGVGGRVGTYLSEQQMRVQGGLDYEWGKEQADNEKKAKQMTLTGGVEKFFPDSPHSVNANVDVYKKSGGYVEGEQKAEVRGGVGYRYDIASEAGVWQPNQVYRRVRTEIPGETVKTPAKVERKLVKHTMELEADTFFKVGSAKLTPEAQERLQAVAGKIRECGHEGNIRISGNTCDVGSTAYNQKLSERRAKSVRDFLVKGGFNANELLAQGLGESSPKYPNTDAERHKNRRVDLEYLCYQNEYKDQVVEQGGSSKSDPKVVWKQELVPTPPLWVRQALHNVADHKQRVDTYKTTAGGAPDASAYTPVAVNDTRSTTEGVALPINVLENDSDPNGDPLTVISFTTPGNGSVTQEGNILTYKPNNGFTGTDSFSYTIRDPEGNTSTATVTVTVTGGGGCTVNADNDTFNVPKGATATPLNVLDGDEACGGTIKVTAISQPANGIVAIIDGGNFVSYQPNAGFAGNDTFTYTITGPNGTSTATVTVTVAGSGGEPIAVGDEATSDLGASILIDVLDNDTDPDGDTLSIDSFTQGANGVVKEENGQLRYTPNAGFVGVDTFTYIVKDPVGNTSTATVRVTVTGAGGSCPANLNPADTVTFTYSNSPDPAGIAITPSKYLGAGDTVEKVYIYDENASSETVRVEDANNGGMTGTIKRTGNSLTFHPSAGYCPDGVFSFYIKVAGCNKLVKVDITLDQQSK